MPRVKDIVDGNETQIAKAFDLSIQSLILFSMVTYAIETLPDLSTSATRFLHVSEVACVAVFTVEYLLRFYAAERKLSFVFSFLGLVDLLAILPFYLSFGIDLRYLRGFRLLRLTRVLKLARYSRAVRRFHRALTIAKEEVVLFLMVTFLLLYFAAVGIYHFEHKAQPDAFSSVFQSLWWAVVTLTTVGYGDAYPVTTGGRCFTFFLLLVGLGIVSVPAGLLASALSKARELEDDG